MKHLSAIVLALLLLTILESCARRRGVDIGMNHRRAPGWHRGGHYGHGTGMHHAPKTYKHWR